jgi:hypothetical protein
MRPVLLLDVDGVLYPFAAATMPAGFAAHKFFPDQDPTWLSAEHGRWVAELATRYEVVWATGWAANANRHIAPALGLPQLPAIRLPETRFSAAAKVPAADAVVGDRPAAWIDDTVTPEAREWAARRAAPTLLVEADPAVGLTRQMVDRCLQWADELAQPR